MTEQLPDEATEFAHAIGELVLWANFIDKQVNEAILTIFALPKHPMILPIVAQLDMRPKLELIKSRLKLVPPEAPFRKHMLDWASKVEKVNERRNIVAHHHIGPDENGILSLATVQLNKLMRNLDTNMKPKPRKTYADVLGWIEDAQQAHVAGTTVLENLVIFRDVLKDKGILEE